MPSLAKVPFKPWEPEESVGLLWDAFVARGRAAPRNAVAAVGLDEMAGRLAVLFRGLGGEHGVEIKQAVPTGSAPSSARASFDGETLRLPACIDWSPERALNEGFYLWLTAACALSAPPSRTPDDPLQADLEQVRRSRHTTEAVLESCRGLAGLHDRLAAACLAMRPPPRRGCREERALDAVVRSLLGAGEPPHDALARHYAASVAAPEAALDALRAPRGYRRFQPPPLWPERRTPPPRTAPSDRADDQDGPAETAAEKKGLFRAKRRRGDQAERKDGLLLHRFESFLSWSEFLNLNRRVEDDDEDAAKKAADDHQDLSLTRSGRAAKTRLTLHLDLAPEDVERERLSGERLYPEWDYRRGAYWPAHCRVLDSPLEAGETMPGLFGDPAARRRIRAVKRQFEALRPRRVVLPRQTDGEELDIDAVVRARADFRASGELPDRLYQATRSAERDLAVAILIDSSRSTEAAVGPSSVIEIAREALAALAWGLQACGDDCAIYAFFLPEARPGLRADLQDLRRGHERRRGSPDRSASPVVLYAPGRGDAARRRRAAVPIAKPAAAAGPDRRQTERPRPLRGPLRGRGQPKGRPGGPPPGAKRLRRDHRFEVAQPFQPHLRARRVRHRAAARETDRRPARALPAPGSHVS